MILYKNYKVYGPYYRKDGRQHVCLWSINNKRRKTVSYPKYLMELYLGRCLKKNETVDHINGNFNDNRIKNLQILDRSVHCQKDAKHIITKSIKTNCVWCKKIIILSKYKASRRISNSKRGKVGPFCCRKCSGEYGTYKQKTGHILKSKIIKLKYSK